MHTAPRTPTTLAPLLLALAAACSAEDPAAAGPPAATGKGLVILDPTDAARPYFHDFGTVPFGKPVRKVFRLANHEGAAVTVHDLLASCACTTPRIAYTAEDGTVVEGDPNRDDVLVLPAGAVADVALAVDTTRVETINKDKLATVRLRCDSAVTPYISFEMHIKVERVFQVTPLQLDFGRIGRNVGGSARCDLVRNPPESLGEVVRVAGTSPGLGARLERSEALGGTPLWIVIAELEPPLQTGPWAGFAELEITGIDGEPREEPLRIPARAVIEDDLFTEPRGLQFPAGKVGAPLRAETVLTSHVPGQRLRVTGHVVRGAAAGDLRAEITPESPDSEGRSARWRIALTGEGLPKGGFSGVVTVELDDDQYPHVDVAYQGIVR